MHIRPAVASDDATIEQIEFAADALLTERFHATEWPPPTRAEERAAAPGFVLVAERLDDAASTDPVGFVHVLETDGRAHLEQLSVLPSYGRRGIGRLLVSAALAEAQRRGHQRVTLRTYADVPWNAPFYASCGFIETTPDSAFLHGLVATEDALGLSAHGRRVQMTVEF
ncbi:MULTISPECIES: GNAT family N-acetyltransferase [unclassified Microbacterium]|uniref:GNAT family N-acetyltransferase n=1 Tax=unclassified Microbacterium TaxID=2609290 RepID=UPI0027DEED1F|nr:MULTISPECIES: GNAT family N-acetyltransferase [unclassified Microbacterium]